jgi:hypothetical protein
MAEHDGGGMNTILTLGLVGVGAYLLYEWLVAPSLQTVAVPAAAGATPGTTPTMTQSQAPTSVSTAPTTTPIVSQSTAQQIQAKMLAAGDDPTLNHSTSQWNYYYAQVAGIPGPTPDKLLPNSPDPINQLVPFSTYWAAMQTLGFSGLGAAFQRFQTPFLRQPPFNMTFVAAHPLPYAPNFTLFHGMRGLGGPVHASGMESALWAGRGLNRHFRMGW